MAGALATCAGLRRGRALRRAGGCATSDGPRGAVDRPLRVRSAGTAERVGWGELGFTSARALVEQLLYVLVDQGVRDGLSGHRLAPGQRVKRSACRAWLRALAAPSPHVVGVAQPEIEALAEQLDAWAGQDAEGRAPFRLCLRLVPPEPSDRRGSGAETDARDWQVEFLLQARSDRSLLVPVEEVWAATGGALLVQQRVSDPEEFLLGELGRALRLYPPLEAGLTTAHPSKLTLSPEGAWSFLREAAPVLEQAGFGIQVPPWWNRPSARLGLKLKASSSDASTSSGLLGPAGLLAYNWTLALGDQDLTAEELAALAASKVPLVQLRGQWVEIRADELSRAIAFLQAQTSGEASAVELLRLGLGLAGAPIPLPVVAFEAEGPLGELLSGEATIRAKSTPRRFAGKLRMYQRRGLAWLAFLEGCGLGACLADDMGLGKTIQVLALLVSERSRRRTPGPGATLLVCPMSVVGNWKAEAERFAPQLSVYVHHGQKRLGGDAFHERAAEVDLVLTTYALATRDRELLGGRSWHRIVLDEAQYIKNSAARQSKAIRSLSAKHRIALTGTPVENQLSELWSILDFLNPGLLGSKAAFRRTFAAPIERHRDEEKMGQLKRLCQPFVLRRLKTDRRILRDLPDKQELKVRCYLTAEQATLYQAVVDDLLEQLATADGMQRRGLILSTMLKLKQVCNHPAQLLADRSEVAGRSMKLVRLEEILDEILANGERALVFTQFAQMGLMLQAHLRRVLGREVLYLHGQTPKTARDRMVARFAEAAGPSLFLLSIKAGGTGLNLTAANHVIHYDRWWNPAVEDQATDRAFRIGQTRDVAVRKLICVGTLEERIDQMIEQKKSLAEGVVGSGEAWLTELSTEGLREVIALSADAVAEA